MMSYLKRITTMLSILLMLMLSSMNSARAGISGDLVSVAYFSTDGLQAHDVRWPQPVSGAGTAFYRLGNNFDLFVTDNQVIATNFSWSGLMPPTLFSGFLLTDWSHDFPGLYTVGPGSNLAGLSAANVGTLGRVLAVNWQGLLFAPDTRVILTLLSPVPEPSSGVLWLAGLSCLLFLYARRRGKDQKEASRRAATCCAKTRSSGTAVASQ